MDDKRRVVRQSTKLKEFQNKGVKKLKNFVSNTSNHLQEIFENKKTTNHQKNNASVNSKIGIMLHNKYLNSPSSLKATTHHSKDANTRISSAYRRSNASSHSSGKHNSISNNPLKELSRIHHLKGESLIKNAKASVNIKSSKSENKSIRKNLQKLRVRDHKVEPYSISNNSHYVAVNLHSIPKNQQNLFPYHYNNISLKQSSEEEQLIEGNTNFHHRLGGGSSGGTDGIYRLEGSLVQKIPISKDVIASKTVQKNYIDKNKKVLNSTIQDDIYLNKSRKYSTISKSSKSKKDSNKSGSYYASTKDKVLKIYQNSSVNHNYMNESIKFHKRSSSDSQKLYDLNKWTNFNIPISQPKCSTNENSSRIRKNTRKSGSKDRIKNNFSQIDKSLERNSIHFDKLYNPIKGYETSDMIMITPRSFVGNANIFQRNSSTLNEQNLANIGTSKGKDHYNEIDNFNSQIDKTVFDSLNSNSKYSSLGGTHSLDKKRQKIKNAIKKKREKPISSSKKSEKEASGIAAFTDPSFVKNYRSANLTKNNGKNIINQNDTSQKRYQYHKRIRSDTGNMEIRKMNLN